jgi:ADP-heptose:LPS heptosyltransferase
MMHEVERGLDLVSAIGLGTQQLDLVLRPREEDRRRAAEIVASFQRPLVVVHPGCSMPARTYPWAMFAQACDLLIERLGATVVLTGVESECDLVARIRARMRHDAVDLAGAMPFRVFCALIEAADLTVTNNTGPMHVSASLKTPVVALFALTNPPEQWGPWRVPHRQLFHDVSCRLCYSRICPYQHECLTLVSPEMVVAAADDLLSGREWPAEMRGAPAMAAGAGYGGQG